MPNHQGVRRILLCALLLATPALPGTSLAAPGSSGPDDAILLAGAGTPLTNGIFIPPAVCDASGCQGVALQVPRGANVRFINLDPAPLTNGHQVVSLKKRAGRPLFKSQFVNGPGETTFITSHLKVGTYPYYCSVHYGMYGILGVVPPTTL